MLFRRRKSSFSSRNSVPFSLIIISLSCFVFIAYLHSNWINDPSYKLLLQKDRDLIGANNLVANHSFSSSLTSPSSCNRRSNIVFLKTHKCASSTIQNIFMRFGYVNDRVFVLPSKLNYLGHPKLFQNDLVPKPDHFGHEYNILTHHSRLNYSAMKSLMPNDTLFITIVRDPIHLFESMFHYYKLTKFWNTTFDVFSNQDYKIPIKVLSKRFIGKIGINQMTFDLGLDHNDISDPDLVINHIQKLDNLFDLVMVAERMEESLILLKHLLCWEMDDIVVFKLNARRYKSNLTKTAKMRIKTLNWADVLLYKHFHTKFDKLVNEFGNEKMQKEVDELRNRTNQWYQFCVQNNSTANKSRSNKNSNSTIIYLINKQHNNTTCILLTADELDFTDFLRMRQIKLFPGSVFPNNKSNPIDIKKFSKRKLELFHLEPDILHDLYLDSINSTIYNRD